MTFRPSDDVLDELINWQKSSQSSNQYNIWNQNEWNSISTNSFVNQQNLQSSENNWINIPESIFSSEEIKAPDLSELLKNSEDTNTDTDRNTNINTNADTSTNSTEEKEWHNSLNFQSNTKDLNKQTENPTDKTVKTIDKPQDTTTKQTEITPKNTKEWINNTKSIQTNYTNPNKFPDEERIKIISSMEWWINSNLDLLIDNDRYRIIKVYKIIHRIIFRWWILICSSILWIALWLILQVSANNSTNLKIINESSIENKWLWIDDTPDKKLLNFADKGIDIVTLIPYWSLSNSSTSFNSKSNLIKYKWIILPQLISINLNSENFISWEIYDAKNLSRNDIEKLIQELITNNSNYRNTTNLTNISESRWIWNSFEWNLVDWFNLKCINNKKVSDIVCDKFLNAFYLNGKYYDLSKYSSELSTLFREIKKQWKTVVPICNMIKDYTLHSGKYSDILISIIENCSDEDYQYYKKLINFIDLENSLGQPELSDKIFEDPDLNAYKLLSAQQSVYKILDWTSINEIYIKSYLKFVQSLIDKDKWSNRYLSPVYKDIIYVFNMDEIYQKLLKRWKLSSDVKIQIDQINNWNSAYGYSSLLSQLTTPDIVKTDSDFTGIIVEEKSLEDLFSQYYAMTDRLKIRKANFLSDSEIKVQTEIFNDKILKATKWETLKATINLYRRDNLLYVNNIKIANQPKFTDILWTYIEEWNITFYAMLNYIDEQVEMRYELVPENSEKQPTFCEEIMERQDISIYSCDDSSISLYKWDIEYNFILNNGVLDSYTISDENLETSIKEKLDWVMFMKDNTPTIITSIIDFNPENKDDNIENKLEIMNQFRIHFKLAPDDIQSIEWNEEEFLIDFTLWEFKLQAHYNINTHLLTRISYANCTKPLEIKQLTLEISSENEPQLIEILNNPRVFLATANPSIYKKYQNACANNETEPKK